MRSGEVFEHAHEGTAFRFFVMELPTNTSLSPVEARPRVPYTDRGTDHARHAGSFICTTARQSRKVRRNDLCMKQQPV
jgi:hypothetical protein